MIPMTTSRRTATQRHSWSILSYGTAISISMATGTWPAVGPPGHATTSPRSACRSARSSRVAHRPRTSKLSCCVSSASARSELAQNCFPPPRRRRTSAPDWREDRRGALRPAVTPEEYAALQRATQYAHYTPETIIRRCGAASNGWALPGAACRSLAWAPACSSRCCLKRCANLPAHRHRIRPGHGPHRAPRCIPKRWCGARITREAIWRGRFDLAIGNPPFSDRVVRADPVTRSLAFAAA